MAGAIDDFSGSYRLAFANGTLWNAVNVAIVLALILLRRSRRPDLDQPDLLSPAIAG